MSLGPRRALACLSIVLATACGVSHTRDGGPNDGGGEGCTVLGDYSVPAEDFGFMALFRFRADGSFDFGLEASDLDTPPSDGTYRAAGSSFTIVGAPCERTAEGHYTVTFASCDEFTLDLVSEDCAARGFDGLTFTRF